MENKSEKKPIVSESTTEEMVCVKHRIVQRGAVTYQILSFPAGSSQLALHLSHGDEIVECP